MSSKDKLENKFISYRALILKSQMCAICMYRLCIWMYVMYMYMWKS